VTAALCVRGVGPERVVGLALPEKEGPPGDVNDAEVVARWLGIRLERHDMTRALREMGAYDFPISRVPGHALRAGVVRAAYGLRTKTPAPGIIPGVTDKYRYLLGLESERLDRVLEGLAAGSAPEEVAARCGIEAEHARRIACVVAAAARMAAVPLVPPLD
jgi:hypothetical protein